MSDRKRLLVDIRVIDLKAELEKRNLDKSGVRGVLIQRLAKHLEAEGQDPAKFGFASIVETKTPAAERISRTESTVKQESEEMPAMQFNVMMVQDDDGKKVSQQEACKEEQSAHENPVLAPAEFKMKVENLKLKQEIKEEPKTSKPKKLLENDSQKTNNFEAEDSINLDIGDDELLTEENEMNIKEEKDELDGKSTERATQDCKTSATSNDGGKSKGTNVEKPENEKEGARNLWISGLSSNTRAKDLKQLCNKHGQVIGAKVVTNARTKDHRCYGYITMANAQDVVHCIKNLHLTELHGKIISVEKARLESESEPRRQSYRGSRDRKDDDKNVDTKDNDIKSAGKMKDDVEGSTRSKSRSREKSRCYEKERGRRNTRSGERQSSPKKVLSSSNIFKELYAARNKRARTAREEKRRRRAAENALRQLAVEREKLRAEREKIEREKEELLRLERERHRLEKEKLELEKLELKAQLRLEEERRKREICAPPPLSISSSRSHFKAPPPPRFDFSTADSGTDKRESDYKRDYPRHVTSSNLTYLCNGTSGEESREPKLSVTRPKEVRRYESRDARAYRPYPSTKSEPRAWYGNNRYPNNAPTYNSTASASGAEESRYGSGEYDPRYCAYQPPSSGTTYPARYWTTRDYRKY